MPERLNYLLSEFATCPIHFIKTLMIGYKSVDDAKQLEFPHVFVVGDIFFSHGTFIQVLFLTLLDIRP